MKRKSPKKYTRKLLLSVGEIHGIWKILAHEGSRSNKDRFGDTRHDNFWTCECLLCGRHESRTTTVLRAKYVKGCRCTLVEKDSSFHRAFRTYKRQARVRHKSFELTLEDVKRIVVKNCYYCGQPPVLNSYSSECKVRVPMNGIDRRDNSMSYTLQNCVPACGMCNKAKLAYTEEEFLSWISRVEKFQAAKQEKDWVDELEEGNENNHQDRQYLHH